MLWNAEYIHCDKWSNTATQLRLWGIIILPICPGVESRLCAYGTIFHFPCVRLRMLELDVSRGTGKQPHSAGRRQRHSTGTSKKLQACTAPASISCQAGSAQVGKTRRGLRETLQGKCFTGLETKTNQTLRSSFFIAINIYRFVICFSGNSIQPESKLWEMNLYRIFKVW